MTSPSIELVHFDDHGENLEFSGAIRCAVCGWVIEEDEETIRVETWRYTCPEQRDHGLETSTFTILKRAITSRRTLC